MSFTVAMHQFEGPLDLMLHLVKEKQLDLFDLDVTILADQYLEYINQMEQLKLEIESDYLVELATLIEYKSLKLLPKQEAVLDSEYQEDPSQALARRLIEYQKFKDVANQLEDSYNERLFQIGKPMAMIVDQMAENNANDSPIDGNPYDLMKAMNKVLRRLQLMKPIDVKFTQKEVSIDDRILQIKARLSSMPETFSFENLIEDCQDLHLAVITFLSVLELCKRQYLIFSIDDSEVIWFKKGVVIDE